MDPNEASSYREFFSKEQDLCVRCGLKYPADQLFYVEEAQNVLCDGCFQNTVENAQSTTEPVLDE